MNSVASLPIYNWPDKSKVEVMQTPEALAKELADCQAHTPSAETLASLEEMNQRILKGGFVYVAKPEFIPTPETDEAFRKRMGWSN